MLRQLQVPDIGDFSDVDVIEVLVTPGDRLEIDQPLITLESDKASMEIPSPAAGVVREVHVKVGDKVSCGDLIVTVEAPPDDGSGDEVDTSRQETAQAAGSGEAMHPPAAAGAPPPAEEPAGAGAERTGHGDFIHAGPAVRRLAREKGVDLRRVTGTGRKGLITLEDLENHLKAGQTPAAKGEGRGIPEVPEVDFSRFGEVEAVPLGRIKQLTAESMTRSWLSVPHVTHHDETDITEVEAFRKSLKPQAEEAGVRLTLLSFFIKACVATLKKYPSFNASLSADGNSLLLKRYYHIGIAVDTPNGLVVPVIRDADSKGLFELSAELGRLSSLARERKLSPAQMQGASFTISSLGGIGGTSFTPIVNAPEVAILGLTRAKMRPEWDGETFRPRLMQPMSLSYDHRVIDGAEAARFLRDLGTFMRDPRLLLI